MDEKPKRLYLLDAYRGVVILSMIAYHFCFDWFVIFHGSSGWPGLKPVFIWEQSICWSFNLLSGFVWNYGRKNCVKRGVIVSLCGFLVTFVTFLVMPNAPVIYGVLTFLGFAMIIMLPLSRLLDRVPASLLAPCSFALFLLTFSVPRGGLGIYTRILIPLPPALYRLRLLTPLGFPHPGFVSSDYFPVIPWILLYVTGYSLNRLLSGNTAFISIASVKVPVLTALGRHSLLIYMLHQPLCYLICMLLR
ncbi:MAG TPA: hypothetical protein DCL38_08340 [Lachnospiraceae bacterium]|nr:hypothetical protein [Lachnospiraceae bacterium]